MDERIDRALSTYLPSEAPFGMEQRILAHAKAHRRRAPLWLAAMAAACAVCAAFLLRPLIPSQSVIPAKLPEAVLPVRSTVPIIAASPLPYPASARRRPRRSALPKLSVFPQIERVPDAEVQLARLALNPEIGKALLAQPDLAEPEPIRIEPLSIKLLDED
jgi:hypothetical protein